MDALHTILINCLYFLKDLTVFLGILSLACLIFAGALHIAKFKDLRNVFIIFTILFFSLSIFIGNYVEDTCIKVKETQKETVKKGGVSPPLPLKT